MTIVAGQVYGFGLYSDVLRSSPGLGLGQAEVNAIALCENVGHFFSLTGGFVYDRFGVKLTLVVGLLLNSIGYFCVYIAAKLAEHCPGHGTACNTMSPPWLLCIFAFCYGHGAAFVAVAATSMIVERFQERQGEAVGLKMCFVSAASGVGSVAYAALFAPSQGLLLLALALLPLVFGLPLVAFVNPLTLWGHGAAKLKLEAGQPFLAAYRLTYALLGVIALHTLAASFSGMITPFEEHRASNVAVLVAILGILCAIATLPHRGYHEAAPDFKFARQTHADVGYFEFIWHRDFLMLFAALAAGQGSGLMMINNLGQLTQALGHGAFDLLPVCVSSFSVMSSLARLVMGQLTSCELPSTLLLTGVLFIMGVVLTCFSIVPEPVALFVVPAMGFGYGCLWTLSPLLVSELFGLKSYGSKFATICFATILGSAPLSGIAVPFFYNRHADSSGSCVGRKCFGGAFGCAGALCLLAACLALRLDRHAARSRKHLLAEALEPVQDWLRSGLYESTAGVSASHVRPTCRREGAPSS